MTDYDRSESRRQKVRKAIECLTIVERQRLHLWAKYLIRRRLGRCATNEDYEDLFVEAITRTLSGERRWPPDKEPNLAFYTFLQQTMRSIASSWAKQSREYRESGIAKCTNYIQGKTGSLFDEIPDSRPSVEQIAINNELISKVTPEIARTKRERDTVQEWLRDITSRETRVQFETMMKRFRRNLSTIRETLL